MPNSPLSITAKYRFAITFLLFFAKTIAAQFCDPSYFSLTYKDKGFINLSKSFVTSDNGIVCLENNSYYNPGLIKFTSQGNIIWSAKYNASFAANGNHSWTDLSFTDAIVVDSGFYVAGSVTKHGLFYDNTETPPARTAAVLIYLDKYGNVVWSKYIASTVTDTYVLTNICKTKQGNLIGFLAIDNGGISYGKVVCFAPNGSILWTTPLNTGLFYSGNITTAIKRSIKQTANGNIIVADLVFRKDTSTLKTDAEIHFMSLNSTSGSVTWETSYQYPTVDSFYVPRFDNITELSNGNLSIQTALNFPTLNDPASKKKQTNIIIDKSGSIKNFILYYPTNGAVWNIDALNDGENQDVLMKDESDKTLLMRINGNGAINWVKKFETANSGLLPSCFSRALQGYNIFLSRFVKNVQLIRTDQLGNSCDTSFAELETETVPLSINSNINSVHTNTNPRDDNESFTTGYFVTAANFDSPLETVFNCRKTNSCCVDVIDTTHIHNIELCFGSSFTLPDNTIIKDSGSYYTVYKTQTGCDSIVYYNLKLYKNPSDLHLIPDTCLHQQDSMILHANDGFGSYTWMNNISTTLSFFTVNRPGTYWVTVSNLCGTKTDTAHVYDKCDFPVYMPTAFTPNGDGVNDFFRVPPQNKGSLIRLLVYDRWGRIVFNTTNLSKGWDGNVNGIPQATGVYVYQLEMKNLSGNKILYKGTFVLVR